MSILGLFSLFHQEKKKGGGEKSQINKIINERGVIATDITETQRTMRDSSEQLHAKKLDHQERNGYIPKTLKPTKNES